MSKIRYLDKTGLKKVLGLLKFGHKKIWHGTQDEWDALSAEEKDKYDQAEIEDQNGITAVDKVEAGNMNPVTSNAVAKLVKPTVGYGTINTEVAIGSNTTCTWVRSGNIVSVIMRGLRIDDNTNAKVVITGLPKAQTSTIVTLPEGYHGGKVAFFDVLENGNLTNNNVFVTTDPMRLYGSFTYIAKNE